MNTKKIDECEYCNNNKSLIFKTLVNDIDIVLEINKNKLNLFTDNLSIHYKENNWLKISDKTETIKIKYCPMCGRKL